MAVSESASLRIRLLGELEARRGCAVLPMPASRRTRALLGFLVASAAPQLRATLCDLLWDGSEDPRAALRWSLTKLRAVVDERNAPRIVADRERVGFQPVQCEVDTFRLRTLLAGGIEGAGIDALEQAAHLLHGEFLDGLELPDCYRFHHWCMRERERHGAQRRKVLESLVARLGQDAERALPWGHAMVAADPLAEAAHATLVRLLAAAGRYPESEQHYEWARDLLRREVSIPAGGLLDEAIHRARRELRDGIRVVLPTPVAASNDLAPASEPVVAPRPLVGRTRERDAVAQLVAGAGQRARLMLFCGEPGIGKTRLLDHLADSSAAAGFRVVRGRCFEAEMVRPYGLWLDALRGVATAGVPPVTLLEAAPLLAGQLDECGNRERLFGAAAVLVRSLAELQPLALLLDDLQWIDEGSAALLHFIARTLPDTPSVLLGGGARAGEVDDNPCAKGLLQSLAREDRLRQHDLGPLDDAAARALVVDAAAALDPSDALRQSGGNPLYLLELARAAQRGAEGTGRSIGALIDERLRALDDGGRDLLAWAAAFGRELRPELLASATGLPVAEVLARLERLVRRGLIAPTGSGYFDFGHDLVREAVYRALSQPRRRAIHRQLVSALLAASADDPWLHGEIVRHAALAGDVPAAARACLAAGQHCLRVFANSAAAAVTERGLAYVDELPRGTERVRLEVGLLHARLVAAASPGARRLPAVAERLERASAAAEVLGLHAEAAAGWEMLSFWQQQASNVERTQEVVLASLRVSRRADAATHCHQLAISGRCLLDIEAEVERGRMLLEQAAALAGELKLNFLELEWGRALLARAAGELDTARAAVGRAIELATLADNHWREYECMVWAATIDYERGRFAEVLGEVEQIVRVARHMGEPQAPFAQALGALARLRSGDAGAQCDVAASLDALRERDDKAHLSYALNEAAALALDAGRLEEAASRAAEALAAAQMVRRPSEIATANAYLAAARGDTASLAQLKALSPPSARAAAALEAAARRVPTVASAASP
jgi:DNA-binding SARP family transcriptional activator